jgi:CHAT domain-containing protein
VFASRFYAGVSDRTLAEALAAAQRRMIADPRYRAPYYWAGYTLSGSGRLREPAKKRTVVSAP